MTHWTVDQSLEFGSWASFTASAWATTRLRWISLLTGCTVVLVNWCITWVVRQVSWIIKRGGGESAWSVYCNQWMGTRAWLPRVTGGLTSRYRMERYNRAGLLQL